MPDCVQTHAQNPRSPLFSSSLHQDVMAHQLNSPSQDIQSGGILNQKKDIQAGTLNLLRLSGYLNKVDCMNLKRWIVFNLITFSCNRTKAMVFQKWCMGIKN